jgi:Uma2 family endonuclease
MQDMSNLTPNILEREPVPSEITRVRMSYEEWIKWDYEGGLSEWVDGEVHIYMPASSEHENLIDFLTALLRMFVQMFDLGAVRTGPYPMRLVPSGNAREPDILFVVKEHLDWIGSDELRGAADLVVEVVSEDSVARDRDRKFAEYEQGGVREYWILDPRPNRLRADFYILSENGRYQPVPLDADGTYHSTVLPNFWIHTDWLWAENMNPLTALAQVIGTENLIAYLKEQN